MVGGVLPNLSSYPAGLTAPVAREFFINPFVGNNNEQN
jgi:hypothetical protein